MEKTGKEMKADKTHLFSFLKFKKNAGLWFHQIPLKHLWETILVWLSPPWKGRSEGSSSNSWTKYSLHLFSVILRDTPQKFRWLPSPQLFWPCFCPVFAHGCSMDILWCNPFNYLCFFFFLREEFLLGFSSSSSSSSGSSSSSDDASDTSDFLLLRDLLWRELLLLLLFLLFTLTLFSARKSEKKDPVQHKVFLSGDHT